MKNIILVLVILAFFGCTNTENYVNVRLDNTISCQNFPYAKNRIEKIYNSTHDSKKMPSLRDSYLLIRGFFFHKWWY